jgi:hypothetical protein
MNILTNYWPIIVAIIGFIIWIIRLESKMNTNNTLFENHQKVCIDRHKLENDLATKNNEDMKKAIDSLFDITREFGNCLHELKGYLDGLPKK